MPALFAVASYAGDYWNLIPLQTVPFSIIPVEVYWLHLERYYAISGINCKNLLEIIP